MITWNIGYAGHVSDGASFVEGTNMTRKIKLEELSKVESSSVIPLATNASETFQAIIKVKDADYVPKGVKVRASISPHILTGDLKQDDLPALEMDPQVESISISKRLKAE